MKVDAQILTLSCLVGSALGFVHPSEASRVEGQFVQLRESIKLLDSGATVPKGSLGSVVDVRFEKGNRIFIVELEGLFSDPAGAVVELNSLAVEWVKPMPKVGRAEEIDHIRCQVCQLLVHEGRRVLELMGNSGTDAVSDVVEDLCSPNELAGRWLKALDLFQESDKIIVMQQQVFGDCRRECSIAQYSCKKTLKRREDSLVSELLETSGDTAATPKLCNLACKKPPKRINGRRVDEIFQVSVGEQSYDLYSWGKSVDAETHKRYREYLKKLGLSGNYFDAAADKANFLADNLEVDPFRISEQHRKIQENDLKKNRILPKKDHLAHQASKTGAVKVTDRSHVTDSKVNTFDVHYDSASPSSHAVHEYSDNVDSAEGEPPAATDRPRSRIEAKGRSSRKDVQSSRSDEAEHVKCQVCKIWQQSGSVFFQQSGKQKNALRVQDALDQICDVHKPAGRWLRMLDLQTVGSSIKVVQQASVGKCRRECFVAQRACESLLAGLEDDDLQSFLSTGGSGKVKELCEEVCEKPRKPLRGKRVDEAFMQEDVYDDFLGEDQLLNDLQDDLEKDVLLSALQSAARMNSGVTSTPKMYSEGSIPKEHHLAHQVSKTGAMTDMDGSQATAARVSSPDIGYDSVRPRSQAVHDDTLISSSAESEIPAAFNTTQIADLPSDRMEVEGRKDVQSSRSDEAEYVKCQVCKILQQSGSVFFRQAGIRKNTLQAQDAMDTICDVHKPAGQWLRMLDLQTVGSSIKVAPQANFGKCRRECFVAQRACESLLDGLEDDDLQSFLSTGGSGKVKDLCEEVCEKPLKQLRGKRVDEIFIKEDASDIFLGEDQALNNLQRDLEKDVPLSGMESADRKSSTRASTLASNHEIQPYSALEAQNMNMETRLVFILTLCCLLGYIWLYLLIHCHQADIKLLHVPSQVMALCHEGAHMRAFLLGCLSAFEKVGVHADTEEDAPQQARDNSSELNVLVQTLQTELRSATARLHELEASLERDRLARKIAEDATKEATRQAQLQKQAFEGERRAKLQAEDAARKSDSQTHVQQEAWKLERQQIQQKVEEATNLALEFHSRRQVLEQEFCELENSNQDLKLTLKFMSQELAEEKACRLASDQAMKLAEGRCRAFQDENAQLLESLRVLPVAPLKEDQILNSLQRILREHGGITPNYDVQVMEVNSLGFTHDTIAPRFRDGRLLEALVEDLLAGRVDAARHPSLLLDVVRFRGAYLSLNNRRLWALKQYQQHQLGSTKGKRGRSQTKPVCVRVRLFELCPVTAKFVLSNTSQTSGATTEIRRSVSRQPRSSSHAPRSVSRGPARTQGWPLCQQRSISRTPATRVQVAVREDIDVVSILPCGLQDKADTSASQRRWQRRDGVAASCMTGTGDSKLAGDSTNTTTTPEELKAAAMWEKYQDPETSKVWWWHPVEQRAVYDDPHNGAV